MQNKDVAFADPARKKMFAGVDPKLFDKVIRHYATLGSLTEELSFLKATKWSWKYFIQKYG